MRRLVYRAAAQRDLTEIARYIARESGSRTTGRNFVERLRQQCARLASAPIVMGRPRPELHLDIRSFPFGNYAIFFRYAAEDFEVVKVIEGHRDIDLAFEEGM